MHISVIMKLVLLTSFILLLACAGLGYSERVQVSVKNGPIVGEKITAEHRTLTRFLGVPYGQAPIGKLRFRKPLPLDRWSKPIEALDWPNSCIQNPQHPFNSVTHTLVYHTKVSEDCLYLNIWSPKVDETDETKLRPVIVWIHGGALLLGSSSLKWYDGETLSARADAVVVSINYRLSTLGFLYSDEVDDVKGNQGLWDQALALEWINENIRYFGGNPNQVTIMGESAGSWSVSLQIVSPVSRNLFQNAIMMSGAAITNRVVNEPKDVVPKWLKGIRHVGCATEQDKTISKMVIECLEQLDPVKVDLIAYLIGHQTQLPPLVVVDGQFLPAKPIDLLNKGDFKTKLNLLIDTVKDEGAFMFYFVDPKFAQENPEKISLQEAKQIFFDTLSTNIEAEIPKETITKVYFDKLDPDHDDADLFRKQVGIAFGDMLLGCPTLEFAKRAFQTSPQTVKVYQWYYTAKLGRNKVLDSKWADTCHTDDIYAVFGGPLRASKWFTNRERDISREVITFIKSFIRTGEPGENQEEWQNYFLTNDGDVIAPYYEIGNNYRTPDNFKYNLKQTVCELIWDKLAN